MTEPRMFAGAASIRVPGERRTALMLLVTVPATLAVIGFAFHGITATQVALLFVGGMVFVSLARGRLLGSSIQVRREEFPRIVEITEAAARRLGVATPQVFIRDDYLVPVNSIGLGEPYAIVLSSQYVQLFSEDELRFMIGREIGHIAAGNTRLLSLINASGRGNAIVTSLFGGWIRQTEYTADRAGLLCSSLDGALKAIAVSTFHVSGRAVEAAMLHDQRRTIESDVTLRLGELSGQMPYAVNRVRAIENFAADPAYRWWTDQLERAPLPVHEPLGIDAGPIERREVASILRRFLALAIDLIILAVIFQAVHVAHITVNTGDAVVKGPHVVYQALDFRHGAQYVRDNIWVWYFPYAAGLVALAGRTIGMMIFDMRVVDMSRARPSIGRTIVRYLLALLSTLTVIPVVYAFVRRVALHDRFSGTRLVGSRSGMT